MSIHGWIAFSLGVTFSLLLWGVLVYISHVSARDGYDDIHKPDE